MSLNYSAPEFNYAGLEQTRNRFNELTLEATAERRFRSLAVFPVRSFFSRFIGALNLRRR